MADPNERDTPKPSNLHFIPGVGWVEPCDYADIIESHARRYGGTGYRYHPEADNERERER